jgi:hypothetical protein
MNEGIHRIWEKIERENFTKFCNFMRKLAKYRYYELKLIETAVRRSRRKTYYTSADISVDINRIMENKGNVIRD